MDEKASCFIRLQSSPTGECFKRHLLTVAAPYVYPLVAPQHLKDNVQVPEHRYGSLGFLPISLIFNFSMTVNM